jgi:hypothetical protein
MLPILVGAGRMAMQALPMLSAGLGALPGLREGDFGKAAAGAGLGYVGGRLGRGGLQAAKGAGASYFRPAAAAMAGTPLGTMASGLKAGAQIGIPLAGGLLAAPLIGGVASGLAGPVSGLTGKAARAATGAAGIGQQVTGAGLPQMPDVPNYGVAGDLSQYGPPGAVSYADPAGTIQSQLRFQNQQEQQSMINSLRYAPYIEAYQQRTKEFDLRREAAGAQLRTALETDAAMRRQAQIGAQRMGESFLTSIGNAGATQYRYL